MLTGSGCGGSGILNQCMPSLVAGQAGRANGAYGKNITAAPGSPNYIGSVQYFNTSAFYRDGHRQRHYYQQRKLRNLLNTTSTQACYVGMARLCTFRATRRAWPPQHVWHGLL